MVHLKKYKPKAENIKKLEIYLKKINGERKDKSTNSKERKARNYDIPDHLIINPPKYYNV